MITPTREEIENRVHEYIVAATGLPANRVVVAEQSRPARNETYGSFKFLPTLQVGEDEVLTTNNVTPGSTLVDTKIRGTRRAIFSVQFFRAGAYDIARRLLNYHLTPMGLLIMKRNDLVFGSVSDVKALDQIVSDRWEEHAGVDLEFFYTETRVEEWPSIGTVSTAIDKTDTTDYTETVEVTDAR